MQDKTKWHKIWAGGESSVGDKNGILSGREEFWINKIPPFPLQNTTTFFNKQ